MLGLRTLGYELGGRGRVQPITGLNGYCDDVEILKERERWREVGKQTNKHMCFLVQ